MIRLIVFVFVLSAALISVSKAQSQEPECSFIKYKPFTIVNLPSGKTIKEVQPSYPPAAKSVGAKGQVVVMILVDRKGNVKKACSNVGHPLLRAASIKAALKWQFKPNFGYEAESSHRYYQTYLLFDFK